jgi:hypothetical protein
MRSRIPRRLIAPLVACSIAGAAAVIGGACLPATAPDPPRLRTGNYVLTAPNFGGLPGLITDSAGRKLRVIADTLAFNITDQTYEERATVAITPVGGTEQAPGSFNVTRRRYTMTASQTFVLPATLYGGMITGDVVSTANIQLHMPNQTIWHYDYR